MTTSIRLRVYVAPIFLRLLIKKQRCFQQISVGTRTTTVLKEIFSQARILVHYSMHPPCLTSTTLLSSTATAFTFFRVVRKTTRSRKEESRPASFRLLFRLIPRKLCFSKCSKASFRKTFHIAAAFLLRIFELSSPKVTSRCG